MGAYPQLGGLPKSLQIAIWLYAVLFAGTALAQEGPCGGFQPAWGDPEGWTWSDTDGNVRTHADLDKIVRDHARWVDSEGREGIRLVLRDANLSGAELSGANLSGAELSGTDLRLTELSGAMLLRANLSLTNLSCAMLPGANLGGAGLVGSDLTSAVLHGADLSQVRFEPSSLPPAVSAASARNLSRLVYTDNPKPLVDLRRAFKELSFDRADREITAALLRHNAQLWETVLFDWTCEFGANAFRPLLLIFDLWGICALLYYLAVRSRSKAGLYLLASGKRVNTGNEKIRVRRVHYPPLSQGKRLFRFARWLRREGHAWSTAGLFSLMSTFNIGFREFNFGRWIRMMQPREFDIKAHGWVRVVSGAQSLLSVGLVGLSLLSYFGRPFEG